MADMFLVIWRDQEEPSSTIRTKEETEKLLEEVAEDNIEWIHQIHDVDSSWWYDRMEDWPAKTGVIIKLQLMKPKSVRVVTKYSLE
jgi:exonuclease III